MFFGASSLPRYTPFIKTSAGTDFGDMFNLATVFNQTLSSWDVSNVITFMACFIPQAPSIKI